MNTLPSGWERKKLGDLFEFKNGLNTDKSQYGKGTKFVNVMDIFNNTLLTENNILGRVTISEKQFEENKLNYGDILFNRTSEIFDEIAMAAVYMDCKPAVFGGFVIRARAIKNVFDAVYSSYGFQSDFFRNQVVKLGQGAIRANIGQKDLAKVNILIPPLSEQTKIANILSTWDKAIQTTEQLLANSQQQKKALMQQLLTGKKRLKGFSGEWKEKKIYEIGMVITGMTPSKSERENYGDDICWATAEDFSNKYIHTTAVKLSILGSKKARILPEGAVLVTCIASIGKNAIAKVRMTTNQQINAIVVNNENFNEFVYYLIEFNRKKLLSLAGITAVPIINKTTFEKIGFLVPTLKEQQKIAQILSTQDQKIDTFQQKLACLKQEKKALMQKLLSGKVRT